MGTCQVFEGCGKVWIEVTATLRGCFAIAADQPIAAEFKPLFDDVEPITQAKLIDEDRSYALYHFNLAQRLTAAVQQATPLSAKFGETADWLGYDLKQTGQDVTLVTYWRAGDKIVTPLQMFVHVLGPDGSIVTQQDRLDVPAYGWRSGDVIAQVQRLTLPANLKPATIEIGLYNPDSGLRLPMTGVDHFILPPLTLR